MRLTHLITTLDVGGAEMMLYRLLKHIDTARFKNQVISLVPPGDVGKMISKLGIPVDTLNMQRGKPSLKSLGRLVRLLKQFQPDVLQTWLYHADLLGLLAGKMAGVPNTLWNVRSSNMDMSQYSRLSKWTLRACSGVAAMPGAVVINSQAGLRYHKEMGYLPQRWELIPNGVDTKLFCLQPSARQALLSELDLSDDAVLVGYVARFDPMKDHATFFRAAREFVDKGYNAHFILCGADMVWSNPVLVAMIDSLGIGSQVHLLGSRRDIANVTAAFDWAVSSSLSEGFPNTVVEAMSCGVPCVVTDVGDSAEIVADTGVVVPPRNVAKLVSGWAELIAAGEAHRRHLGKSARQRIIKNYSLDKMIRAYEELYGRYDNTAV